MLQRTPNVCMLQETGRGSGPTESNGKHGWTPARLSAGHSGRDSTCANRIRDLRDGVLRHCSVVARPIA